jgi:hypothetical protein
MALPPLSPGAVHESVDEPFPPEVAVTEVGAPGALSRGVVGDDGKDGELIPITFIAFTVNV